MKMELKNDNRSKLGLVFGDEVIALKGMANVDIEKGPSIMTKMATYKVPSVDGKRQGVNFINVFTCSFYARRSQKRKKRLSS